MSKLFEAGWSDNYEYFERSFCTETKSSEIKKILAPAEWFEEYSKGTYESILDSEIKLKRNQGNSKDGRNHYGFTDPTYRNIRENFWNEHQKDTYNKTPRIFYLDIETRVGHSFSTPESTGKTIKIREKQM